MTREFTLVCFAVKEEAAPFRRLAVDRPDISVLLTGMGRRNAAQAVRQSLAQKIPKLLITAGFAGGLNQAVSPNTVLFDAGNASQLEPLLKAAGALPAKFHCSDRVATTAAEKKQLYASCGADAVEMESAEISAIAHEANIPCATIRVILDPVNADLPLDFNALMTSDLRLSAVKLAAAIARSPSLVPKLMRFQKESASAAEALAQILYKVLDARLNWTPKLD